MALNGITGATLSNNVKQVNVNVWLQKYIVILNTMIA